MRKTNSDEKLLEQYTSRDPGLIARYLGVKKYKMKSMSKFFPSYKQALFCKAVSEVIKDYEERVAFDISRGEIVTASYEYLEVGRNNNEELMTSGYRLILKDEIHLSTSVFYDGWSGVWVLELSYANEHANVALAFFKAVDDYMRDNNFYRGEKIDTNGKFLPLSDMDFEDVILPEMDKKSIKLGALDFFDKKDIYIKNKIPYKRGLIFTGVPGCQPKGEQVLMADTTWKNVEDIQLGDKVISPQKDGSTKVSNVVSLKEYDSEIYTINLNKGDSYRVAAEHLVVGQGGPLKDYDTIMAKDLYKPKGTKKRIKGVFSQAIEMPERVLSITPYHLGMLIGDGSLKHNVCFTTVDSELLNEANILCNQFGNKLMIHSDKITHSLGKHGGQGKVRNKLMGEVRNLGLLGKGSHDKFIPLPYLNSSIKQRLELLAGLIDTDGYKDPRDYSTYEYTTVSFRLAEDVKRLCKSLGFGVAIKLKKTSWTHKGIKKYGEAYRLCISTQDYIIPVKLERKVGKLRDSNWKNVRHQAMDVVKENKVEKVYGFTLDSESQWYVTNNYILTHNTGKTLTGKILMNSCDATFLWITSDILSKAKYQEAATITKNIFDMARELSPCILFVEDIDDFLEKEGAVDAIKTQMDGMDSLDGIVTILCTNFPDRLPMALIDRPSRFDDVVLFHLPDEDLRFAILKKVGEPMDIINRDSILKEIAKETEGLTGSHLKEIMVYALLLSADDARETITEDDLAKALLKVKKTKETINDKLSEVNVKCLVVEIKKDLNKGEIKKNKESGK